ncbi:MAG: ArsI/CadI family heavy metal resistance metalloenzyme [Vulcanimicrobiaceae bacterium]
MKTHLSLTTSNLDTSISFYSALLDRQPAKILADYALFIAEDPGIELALALSERVAPSSGDHFGIWVESVDDVERAIARLTRHGLVTAIERDETCCYARQTKVWTSDPEGRRWEVYAVHEEAETGSDGAGGSCDGFCGCSD